MKVELDQRAFLIKKAKPSAELLSSLQGQGAIPKDLKQYLMEYAMVLANTAAETPVEKQSLVLERYHTARDILFTLFPMELDNGRQTAH